MLSSSAESPLSCDDILESSVLYASTRSKSFLCRKNSRTRTLWAVGKFDSAMKWLSSSMVFRKAVACGSRVARIPQSEPITHAHTKEPKIIMQVSMTNSVWLCGTMDPTPPNMATTDV